MQSMRSELRRGVFMGAPVGYAAGLFVYGGIGHLVAGQPGLLVGCILATVFAVLGLHLGLRYVEAISREL